MNYWLIKSEPKNYSIEDLKRDGETIWDGVRNYQARNFLRQMNKGDLAFFYHSNVKPPGIVGLTCITQSGIDDPTQFDPNSKYYDSKATIEQPRWQTVVVKLVEVFPHIISLSILKENFTSEQLLVVKKGNRLSVIPIEEIVAQQIFQLAQYQ